MPTKASYERQAWVKVAAPKKPKVKKFVNPIEQKEALCARLRYFACQPMDSRDKIRMLNRPIQGGVDMVDIDRAPSPVPDQWTGAGLMFQNGARGGAGGMNRKNLQRFRDRGFHMESDDGGDDVDAGHRVVSEPVRAPTTRSRSRARTVVQEEDLVEVIEEPSLYNEDIRSRRGPRSRRSSFHLQRHHEDDHDNRSRNYSRDRGHNTHKRSDHIPIPADEDIRSRRSASPPPPTSQHIRSSRQRDHFTTHTTPAIRPQVRHITAPIASQSSRVNSTPTPVSSTYQFQSAIFKPKHSANNYREVYEKRNKDGSVGPGNWASATSALSFD